MSASSVTRRAQIDHLLATWRADNPDFFWCPSDDSTLLIDQRRGVVGTPVGGASVRLGGMLATPTPVAGASAAQYIQFATTLGIGANGTFFGMLLVDVPNPDAVTGAFIKIGVNGTNGVGFGGGGTTMEDSGSKLIQLREGIAWDSSASGAFVKGLNVVNILSTNEGAFGAIVLNTGANCGSLPTYTAPTTGVGINGYFANRTSNAVVRAVALWTSSSYTNAQTVDKRQALAASVLPLRGTSGAKLWTPRRVPDQSAATGGSVSLTPSRIVLSITGPIPTVGQTTNSSVQPAQATLSIAGPAPTVVATSNVSVQPAQAQITLAGPVPTVDQSSVVALVPAAAALAVSGPASTLAQSANVALQPAQSALALSGPAATVTVSSGLTLTPAAAVLAASGPAPTLAQTTNISLSPTASALVLGIYAPTVAVSGAGTGATAAEIWGYVMSNGQTAEANVVAIRTALDALTPAAIADYLLHSATV